MHKDVVQEKIAQVMAGIFELEPKSISQETNTKNIDNWDSLNQIKLIVALEDEFDIEFEPEEIAEMTSFLIIETIVKSKIGYTKTKG